MSRGVVVAYDDLKAHKFGPLRRPGSRDALTRDIYEIRTKIELGSGYGVTLTPERCITRRARKSDVSNRKNRILDKIES